MRRFATLLPVAQAIIAAIFGGIGLLQRSKILSKPAWEHGTLWDTTARFHVWPWPFKFAVILNFPAFLAGGFILWPLDYVWPQRTPELMVWAPLLLFVFALWFFIGREMDRWWKISDQLPHLAVGALIVLSLIGAFLPMRYMGYVGYLPYGALAWSVMGASIYMLKRTRQPRSSLRTSSLR